MLRATPSHTILGVSTPATAAQILPVVYQQLRELAHSRMANERSDHTLQPTALVHEAYQRLTVGQDHKLWDNRGHFFAAAAQAMRRILIESARAKKSQKRGGNRVRIPFDESCVGELEYVSSLLDVDEGLRLLAIEDAVSAELVELRLFGGLSVAEAGEVLGLSRTTAYETWTFARCWFAAFLK